MDCKIIQQMILEDQFVANIYEHLDHCDECKAFYENAVKIETQLRETYSGEVEFTTHKKNIMNKVTPKRNFKLLLVSVLLLATITVTFAEELYYFAEEIPLVGDLLRYFSEDNGAEAARENNYPIQDFILEKEDYRLLIKDFYYDPYSGHLSIALERNGEYIKGFSYGLFINNNETYWREERNEMTPWSDIKLGNLNGEDYTISIGVRVDDREIIFDEIKVSYDLIEQYTPQIIDCNETIETEYGNLIIDNIEIYPAAMYMNTSYDFDESVIMFHLMDLKLKDNLGNVYEEDSVSQLINPSKQQRFRLHGTSYNNEAIKFLELSLSSIKIKKIDELVSTSPEELEGYLLEIVNMPKNKTFKITDVQVNNDNLNFNLDYSETEENFPIHLAIYANNQWSIMDKLEEEFEMKPKSEQVEMLPIYVFCEWLDIEIEEIVNNQGQLRVIERSNSEENYHKYEAKQSGVYSRDMVEKLLVEYNVNLSVVNLDDVFKVNIRDPRWINIVDLEVISEMSIMELKDSIEGKVKLINYFKHYYAYYDLSTIDGLIADVEAYGSLGIGGYTHDTLSYVKYGGPYNGDLITIGIMIRYEYRISKTFKYDF